MGGHLDRAPASDDSNPTRPTTTAPDTSTLLHNPRYAGTNRSWHRSSTPPTVVCLLQASEGWPHTELDGGQLRSLRLQQERALRVLQGFQLPH